MEAPLQPELARSSSSGRSAIQIERRASTYFNVQTDIPFDAFQGSYWLQIL